MHLIRERYRSFQPLLIDEMMQGQRMARTGVSCYKPDVWAFEEVRCLRLVLLLSQLGTPHSDFPGPNSGITACVAVIRHKQLVVSNDGDMQLSFYQLKSKYIVTASPHINTESGYNASYLSPETSSLCHIFIFWLNSAMMRMISLFLPAMELGNHLVLQKSSFCDSDTEGMIDLLCCWP
ncbi:BnaC03g67240D [Brassica napus]|uniref:BnaC03g67240D protein n=1 Tax=Brassica napus TaxID=3708 RepID=A0A078IUM0_BRANA|nr:BnaC03g67240D [Brassica napus]